MKLNPQMQNEALIMQILMLSNQNAVLREEVIAAQKKAKEVMVQNEMLKEAAAMQEKAKKAIAENEALMGEMTVVKNKLNQANLKYREVTKRNAEFEEQRKAMRSTRLRRVAYRVAEKGILGLFKK